MTSNAVIGFPRYTTAAAWSGGSYAAAYPVSNLAILPLSRVARSSTAAAADTKFVASFATPVPLQLLTFVRHNATLDGTFRIRLYSDTAGTSLLYDTGAGVQFWPPVYPLGSLAWGDPRWWSGQYSTAEIAGYSATRPVWLPQQYLVGCVKVDVVDTGNPAGFFQCGMFDLATGWPLSHGPKYGSQYGHRARTTTLEAIGGVKYHNRQDKPRVFVGVVDYMPRDEALSIAFEHQRQSDLDTPFVWLPDTTATVHLLRNCWLAKNASLDLADLAVWQGDSVPLKFEEVL